MRCGEEWQHVAELNAIFQESLHMREQEMAVRLLAVDLEGSAGQQKSSSSRRRPVIGLDRLSMVYKASWPINIVIEANSLETLNRVFRFLLHLKYAKWSVDNAGWKGSSLVSSRVSGLSQVRQLALLLRVRLLHFLNALHIYIMTRILHSVANEFQQAVQEASHLDAVISATRDFVQLAHNRCLLNDEASYVHEAIMKLLRLSVHFRQVWDSGLPNSALPTVESMLDEFSRCNRFLISVLQGIVQRGSFPHLEALACLLDSAPVC